MKKYKLKTNKAAKKNCEKALLKLKESKETEIEKMRQIITIISLFCCISISAQDRTPIDKICEEISHVKDFVNIPIKHKINNGDGVVVY